MALAKLWAFGTPVCLLALGVVAFASCGAARGASSPSEAALEIMQRHGCAGCHTIEGVRGADSSVGPPLTKLGRRVYVGGRLNTPDQLVEFIVNPSAERPSPMPNVGIGREEATVVARYLSRLR